MRKAPHRPNARQDMPAASDEGREVTNGMPRNGSTKADDQQNMARFKSEAKALRLNKMSSRPPSLNKINKNLP